jgi:hypothetical protein
MTDCCPVLLPPPFLLLLLLPGDEPLYTQECGPDSAPVIAAHARHTVLLQPGETVAQCFGLDQPDTQEQQQLTFEVYDKWPQDPDSLAASGALPLQQVRGWEGAGVQQVVHIQQTQ